MLSNSSTKVTLTPNSAKKVANSTPITLPPTMMILAGRIFKLSKPSEVKMRSDKFISGSICGSEPQAIIMLFVGMILELPC